jgi:hypothetical protein
MRVRVSWGLLTLVAISVMSMPVTQHLWAWDGYLGGGQDFETGAFLILISLCLVLVLAASCSTGLARFLSDMRPVPVSEAEPREDRFLAVPSCVAEPGSRLRSGYSFPLQI